MKGAKIGLLLLILTNGTDLERASGAEYEVGFETHFDVVVPPGTAVKVHNEHGAVDVTDVARAEVSGSFDTIRVERVGGPAEIEARHGDVQARGIKGDLKVTNRHGDVTVEDIDGHATLDVRHGEGSAKRAARFLVSPPHRSAA